MVTAVDEARDMSSQQDVTVIYMLDCTMDMRFV